MTNKASYVVSYYFIINFCQLEELEVENKRIKERNRQDHKKIVRIHEGVFANTYNIIHMPQQSKVYPKQSYHSHWISPHALQPLLHVLQDDAHALRTKVTTLKNTALKLIKNYAALFKEVK